MLIRVALKFVVSNPPNKGYEQRVLKWLSLSPLHPGKRYVIHLIDSFAINGPNGQHDVLVMDVVGPT
jgi:serine/threonine-protein kinase SRPK3